MSGNGRAPWSRGYDRWKEQKFPPFLFSSFRGSAENIIVMAKEMVVYGPEGRGQTLVLSRGEGDASL